MPIFKDILNSSVPAYKKSIKMVSSLLLIPGSYNFQCFVPLIAVSSMNRMVNQVGTAQETPEIRQQL
jgi:hypothetical protein